MKLSRAAIAAIAGVLILGTAGGALLYAKPDALFKAAGPVEAEKSELARFAVGRMKRLHTPAGTPVAPDYVFKTREGADARFADFRGKVVVVNLWAMWCAPCVTEMPTLQALAKAYEGKELLVLPINVDVPERAADALSFMDVHEPLPFYADSAFKLPFVLPGESQMPQTVVLDRQGRIRAWYVGEADWAGPEARALIDALLAETA
jgi:thiol-disulfide isomerase/thioredoxin